MRPPTKIVQHHGTGSAWGQPRPARSDFWQPHDGSASKADVVCSLAITGPGILVILTNPGGRSWIFKRKRFPQRRDESPGTRASSSARSHLRTRLQIEGRTRDLAMFNLAIDSKLRGCDVVALRVEDVAPSGYAVDRATVRQKKTGRPVRFELTEQTRRAVDDYITAAGKKPGEFLFSGRGDNNRCITTRQYARLVSSWVATIGLDPHFFATHSLRRTKATLIYRRTGNLRAVQLLLG